MDAIVLSRRDIKEHDQIISVLTKDQGKLDLYARGVKKIVSKNTAHLEPFSVVDIDIAAGKEFGYVTRVQSIEYFVNIRNDLEKSMAASYVVSLVDRLTQEGERDVRLYAMLFDWLQHISEVEDFLFFLIDCYIVVLLYCLGFSIAESNENKRDLLFFREIEHGNWDRAIELSREEKQRFHRKIHAFLAYHTEKKHVDWLKTCII